MPYEQAIRYTLSSWQAAIQRSYNATNLPRISQESVHADVCPRWKQLHRHSWRMRHSVSDQGLTLALGFLGHVEKAYDGFMPRHSNLFTLKNVHVYTMGNLRGVSMYLAWDRLYANECKLLRQTPTGSVCYLNLSRAKLRHLQLIITTSIYFREFRGKTRYCSGDDRDPFSVSGFSSNM